MKRKTLDLAVQEARRFIRTAEVLQRADGGDRKDREDVLWTTPTRFTAACRRSSMDLTRILADLRQGH